MILLTISRRMLRASMMPLLLLLIAHTAGAQAVGAPATGIESRSASVNGTRLHYLIAGRGPAVLLLHGFGETSHMWRPLMVQLAAHHTVIAPDPGGAGGSAKPAAGYDKKTLAEDVHALAQSLGEAEGDRRRA